MRSEINANENARVSHLPPADGVQNSPNNFDLNPVILSYDLWPTTFTFSLATLTLTLVTLTLDHLFWNQAKIGIFTFLTLVTLTFDLDFQSC